MPEVNADVPDNDEEICVGNTDKVEREIRGTLPCCVGNRNGIFRGTGGTGF